MYFEIDGKNSKVDTPDIETLGRMKNRTNPHLTCKYAVQNRNHFLEILNNLYPSDSKCSEIRKKLRCSMLISESIGRKRYLPIGSLGYIFEKEKHLTQHLYMIHPHSRFLQFWETSAIMEYFFSFMVRLFLISQWHGIFYYLPYQILALISDLFQTSDVLLQLLVGYVDDNTESVVLEYREVLFHNILNLIFYVNLIASLPLDFFIYLYSIAFSRPPAVFRFFCFVKILKIFTLSRYLKHVAKTHNWGELTMRIVMFIFISIHIGHWLTCLHFVSFYYANAARLSRQNLTEVSDVPLRSTTLGVFFIRHLQSFYVICTTFFGQNMFSALNLVVPLKNAVVYFFLINIINFFQIFFVCMFMQVLALLKTSKILYHEMTQEVQKLLAQENLPKYMHKKVLQFLKFRYGERYYDENVILETLSPPLKREVKNFLCYDLVINPESIFNALPKDMASELCLLMKMKVYMGGDTIFRAGQKSKAVYFLYSGSVVIYSSKGKELTHWYKGQQFGVAGFVDSHLYLVTALALEMSEIYILRYDDFLKVTKENPELVNSVVLAASRRIDTLLREFTLESW